MIDDRRVEVEAECLSFDVCDLQRVEHICALQKGLSCEIPLHCPADEAWSCLQALSLFRDIYLTFPRGD